MAKCFLSSEIDDADLFPSVSLSWHSHRGCISVRPSKSISVGPMNLVQGFLAFRSSRQAWIGESEFNTEREQLSSQLTRQIRSHKHLQGINWKICNELDAGNAEHKNKRSLDEVFFWKRETNMKETNARIQKDTRELHLELVDDKVTYVRVYWLRSQVKVLDHRSYSSFKLKMGLPFFV